MTDYSTLSLSVEEGVARLLLTRPEILNRFDDVLINELTVALVELARDEKTRVVVFGSTGEHFSAGGDFEMMLAANQDHNVLMRQVDDGRRLFRTFVDFPKPVVVALHGNVFGVGTSLVLTADAIVTMSDVIISDPHVHMGLVAGDGGCISWPANMSLVQAKRHLLWGEPLTGARAYELGVVTQLVESIEMVDEVAQELAGRVSKLPPVAVQLTKRALNRHLMARVDETLDVSFYLEAISAATEDLKEAVSAFREKRPGKWTGT